jgi:hypothetical protein
MAVVKRQPAVTQQVEVAVAVTNSSLRALTAAALLLPGLANAATDDEAKLQYGYYIEGERQLPNKYKNLKFKPIQVDNLTANTNITLADRVKFAFNYNQDTWSGATPITTAPTAVMYQLQSGASMAVRDNLYVNTKFQPLIVNRRGQMVGVDKKVVHMMTTASPETRKQGDFKLGYEWDETRFNVGGGLSVENDYNSYFVNGNGRLDFNQKQTTLNMGLNYNHSSIKAKRDPNYSAYIDYSSQIDPSVNSNYVEGKREDVSAHFGLSQIISKNSVFETGVSYTHSTGFLENPYKVVEFIFVDPDQMAQKIRKANPDANKKRVSVLQAQTQGVLEKRPDIRDQWTLNTGYVQYLESLDASVHFNYSFFHDNWGINAHTFELNWGQPIGAGWTITPRVRYYTQHAARFYQPYFVFNQAKQKTEVTFNENDFIPIITTTPYDLKKLPVSSFSSDHRLSGYGALTGGVTISKQFSKGISFNAGFEYYTHSGSLKLGGNGEGDYANFDSYLINAGLQVNLSAFAGGLAHSNTEHTDHSQHMAHMGHSGHAPAGVMFDHLLGKAGDFMVGYRYMYHNEGGRMLHGVNGITDAKIIANGCGNIGCSLTPSSHSMNMHMLDIMYAPTDWLNLMLMPQFVDMDMTLRQLEGAATNTAHNHGGGAIQHNTGGVGDTGVYALFRLVDWSEQHLHLGLGISAPTGSVNKKLILQAHNPDTGEITSTNAMIHYGMQLGSGTWDFRPSLTYTGQMDNWSWGAQINGVKRLESRNDAGFAFGDMLQTTAWGSYKLFDWLSASVRGMYTRQGPIQGEYTKIHDNAGPMDFPDNYGGQYWDVGFGLNAMITGGEFAGNHFGFEWVQPVAENLNGYQLEREGALSATWSLAF